MKAENIFKKKPLSPRPTVHLIHKFKGAKFSNWEIFSKVQTYSFGERLDIHDGMMVYEGEMGISQINLMKMGLGWVLEMQGCKNPMIFLIPEVALSILP